MTEIENEIKDSLLNAVPRVGGAIGIIDYRHESKVVKEMISRGLIGPSWGLTRKGAEHAKWIQHEAS